MHIVLWDTRKSDVSKDFAGGFGVGHYPGGGGLRGWIIRRFFKRDRRPVSLLFAHLAAIFRRLGHTVEYAEDRIPNGADLYVFCPSLITLSLERDAISQTLAMNPTARVFVAGLLPSVMPEAFSDLDVTIVRGEAEQLYWKLDEVLQRPAATVHLGITDDLDRLPLPDWSLFNPQNFRIAYDFWLFPSALIQASRGCTFKCGYCPYILLDNSVRFREPEAVFDEMLYDIRRWSFRSFKFRDPLFGLSRPSVYKLAELIGKLPRKIQFSIETRIEMMPLDVLRTLKSAGLTSITVGIESPDAALLGQYHRPALHADRHREFIDICRSMGIRTVAGFLIGFPDDTEQSIRDLTEYAKWLNPTFANFNMVTPYPGTEFFAENKDRIGDADFSRYSSYYPVLKYKNFSTDELIKSHGRCFNHFYFRKEYLRDNAHLIWPALQRFSFGKTALTQQEDEKSHSVVPRPLSGLELLKRRGLRTDSPHNAPRITNER